jgi:4-amino-4-deoxy-L-arabinose transferase-like glycosyltransferase
VSRRRELFLVSLILLLGAFLRLYRLDDVPPGWRDDEVVETAVHAQRVLDGSFPLYFPQAEGHEPLHHYLSAGLIALAGRSLFAVRLLSAYLGIASLAALYRFARRFFGAAPALVATLALAVSFWGLMYARFKLRHISAMGLMLLAFYFFLAPLHPLAPRPDRKRAVLAGLLLALCLHTYFAARAVPLILLAFVAYLLLFHRGLFRAHWRSFALTLLVAGLLVSPLAWAIARTPGGEARLSVVGRPLQDLWRGDLTYVLSNTYQTLGMFAFTGDPEYLYNIPGRPVFEAVGAALFLSGVLVSAWRWRQPQHAFLLIWLLGGLSPAFVSTPAASLGHTIVAQPVVYLFPAIALTLSYRQDTKIPRLRACASSWLSALPIVGAGLFLGLTAARDLRDYFARWPALAEVRYLYRADLHEAAAWLNAHPPAAPDIALTSRNLHQADAAALQLDTPALGLRTRLFDPTRAWVSPQPHGLVLLRESAMGEGGSGLPPLPTPFEIRPADQLPEPDVPMPASFENDWTCTGYTLARDPMQLSLHTFWTVGPGYAPPPPRPIEHLAGSPIPLRIFAHFVSVEGVYLTGGDDLGVDPATLRPGDSFVQFHRLPVPADLAPGEYAIEIGLYNPVSGAREPLSAGGDRLRLTTLILPP